MISAKISNETRKQVYRRDGYRCALCDSTKYLQVHHCIKRSRGGTNSIQNLICLCADCHALAHGTNLNQWDATQEEWSRPLWSIWQTTTPRTGTRGREGRNPGAREGPRYGYEQRTQELPLQPGNAGTAAGAGRLLWRPHRNRYRGTGHTGQVGGDLGTALAEGGEGVQNVQTGGGAVRLSF